MENSKKLKKEENDILELDKQVINETIRDKKKYILNNIKIQRWEGDLSIDSYSIEIKKDNSSFIGILNGKFERDGYGINKFPNGDIYFGYFENDQRNRHGIYFYSPEKKDKIIHEECYYGFWLNNQKNNHGIYLWIDEPENNIDFDNANFDCFIGNVKDDHYNKGCYLSKIEDNYYLYYGYFDEEGKKNDNNALFYSSSDKLIKGKIVNDIFTEGFIGYYDSETGNLNNFVFCKFDDEGSVIYLKKENEFNNDVQKIKNEMQNFRSVILESDYFGDIYQKYREIKKFINDNMNTVSVFDNKEKFPEMIELCVDYNSFDLFSKIEKIVYHRKKSM